VTTSLIAEGAWAAAAWIEGALNGAKFFGPHNRKKPPNALLNTYRTSDDRWLLLVAAQQKDWPGFVKAIELPALLEDARFIDGKLRAQNAAALVDILDPLFAGHPLAHWKKVLDDGRVIFGVVQIADEIVHDPQMLQNNILVPLGDPSIGATYTVSSPLQVANVQKVVPSRAPLLGEHSTDVLRDLGYSVTEIGALCTGGTVSQVPSVDA